MKGKKKKNYSRGIFRKANEFPVVYSIESPEIII